MNLLFPFSVVDEDCVLLVSYAVCSGKSKLMFRDILLVPSSREDPWIAQKSTILIYFVAEA